MNLEKKIKILQKYIRAGYRLFPLGGDDGKKPLIKNWQNIKCNILVALSEKVETGNFGITLQGDDLVIDVDPRGFEKDDMPHTRLSKIFPEIKNTLIVQTGRGG